MRTLDRPMCADDWTVHERSMVHDLITRLRSRPADVMTIEVRKTRDGRLLLFNVRKEEFTSLRQ